MRRFTLAATVVAALLTTPLTVRAQGMGEAEQYFHDGERYYGAGDYESSIAAFQRAYDLLEGNPNRHLVLFNIARNQEALFRYAEALQSYQTFLASADPNSAEAREARERVRILQAELATLQIASNATAQVWIDDHDTQQTAPGNILIGAGRHVVELRARGYAPERQDVQVAARTVIPLSYTLERSFGGLSPAFVIVGAGLTLAALGVGVGFGAVAMGERSTIDGQLADDEERYLVTRSRIASMEESALIADVMFGVAGGLAIATVVMVFLTDWGGGGGGGSAEGPVVLPYASGTEVGVAVGGTL